MSKNKKIEESKKLLKDVSVNNGTTITDVISHIEGMEPSGTLTIGSVHVPINTLKNIKEILGRKKKEVDETGNEILVPLYCEEEKAKVIFGLLAERGINLLDHLENCLGETGYSVEIAESINNTMGRVAEVLRDISEIQYKKSKLENERVNLEIQKYKADLKKRELDIKERQVDQGPTSNNIIAVGSTSELLEIMSGKKSSDSIKQAKVIEDS